MRKWKKKARPVGVYILYILVILAFLTPIYWVIITSFKQPGDMFAYPPQWYVSNGTLAQYKKVLLYYQFCDCSDCGGFVCTGSVWVFQI